MSIKHGWNEDEYCEDGHGQGFFRIPTADQSDLDWLERPYFARQTVSLASGPASLLTLPKLLCFVVMIALSTSPKDGRTDFGADLFR